jgi:hypothetical protein
MELQTIITFLVVGLLVGFVAGVGVTVWCQLAGRFAYFHINEPEPKPCTGCVNLIGRHCMLSTNHCTRRAEDYFDKEVKK